MLFYFGFAFSHDALGISLLGGQEGPTSFYLLFIIWCIAGEGWLSSVLAVKRDCVYEYVKNAQGRIQVHNVTAFCGPLPGRGHEDDAGAQVQGLRGRKC